MALKAPTLFYKHTDAFFKQIWKVLVSPKVDIRKHASLALRHTLRLVRTYASIYWKAFFSLENDLTCFRGCTIGINMDLCRETRVKKTDQVV